MSPRHNKRRRSGFTLLEMLIAVVLLATAFTIIWSTFSTTITGWEKGKKFLEEFHHGDFVMEQLVSSLRSAAFFPSRPDKFGFWLENRGGGSFPKDEISWVTSGMAFMKPDHPLAGSLHRIMITIENNDDGDPSVAVRAFPHLLEEIEKNDVDPWFISSRVKGLRCRVYNFEEEDWEDEWENSNAIPSLVEVTVMMDPVYPGEGPVKIRRVVTIPVAPAVSTAAVSAQSPMEPDAPVDGTQPDRGGAQVRPGQAPVQSAPGQQTRGGSRVRLEPRRGGSQ